MRVASALVALAVVVTPLTVLRAYATTKPVGFYLDIGASSSRGFEPSGRPGLNGAPTYGVATRRGYSNDLVALEAPHVTLDLTEIGCPGETSVTMVGLEDHCYRMPTTQMSIALNYLAQRRDEVGVVTIDIGFNDLRPCISQPEVNMVCARKALDDVRENMPEVLAKLKSAAGPRVHFVGLTYADPFLAYYLKGAAGRLDAAQTLVEMTRLNTILVAAYVRAGMDHDDLPVVVKSADTSPVKLTADVVVPKDVQEICATTWMCRVSPWGPDDHPNDAGYRVIAQAIARRLPDSW